MPEATTCASERSCCASGDDEEEEEEASTKSTARSTAICSRAADACFSAHATAKSQSPPARSSARRRSKTRAPCRRRGARIAASPRARARGESAASAVTAPSAAPALSAETRPLDPPQPPRDAARRDPNRSESVEDRRPSRSRSLPNDPRWLFPSESSLLSALAPPLVPTLELLYAYRPERITWSVLADFFGSDGSGDPPGLASLASFRSFPPKPPPAMFDSSPSANARRSRTARRAARTACSPASPSSSVAIAARSGGAPSQSAVSPSRSASRRRSSERRVPARSGFSPKSTWLSKPERRSLSPARGESEPSGFDVKLSASARKVRSIFSAKTTSPSSARTARGKSTGGAPASAPASRWSRSPRFRGFGFEVSIPDVDVASSSSADVGGE